MSLTNILHCKFNCFCPHAHYLSTFAVFHYFHWYTTTPTDLKKQIFDLEAQCELLKEARVWLERDVMELKGKEEKIKEKYLRVKEKHVKLKEKLETEQEKWMEEEGKIVQRCRQLEIDNRKLEIDLEEAVGRIGDGGEEAIGKLKAEVEHLKSLLKDSDGRNVTLLAKNESLESHNCTIEKEFESQLAMETSKLKAVEEKNIELLQKIKVLERLGASVEVEETTMLEAESKKVQELVLRIVVLERMNNNMSEEVKMIMTENTALKEKHEKKILELVLSIGVLEREKRRLEEVNREKDEKIKMLLQEREHFPFKKKKMEMDTKRYVVKSENGVLSPQQGHPIINFGTSSNLTVHDQGGGHQRTSNSQRVERSFLGQ